MYKYLMWDIDGTVLNFAAAESFAMRMLFKKFNLGELNDEMLYTYSSINAAYWQALEQGKYTRSEIQINRFRDFFRIIGVDITLAENFNRSFIDALGEHPVFMDNAEDVLKSGVGKYKQIAITNGTRSVQKKKISLSGLDVIFDAVFISEDVGAEKPSVNFFEFVLKAMKIDNKKEALIIGDSLTADMKGGENSGIDTCWFNPEHKQNKTNINITYEIDNFIKVTEILKL